MGDQHAERTRAGTRQSAGPAPAGPVDDTGASARGQSAELAGRTSAPPPAVGAGGTVAQQMPAQVNLDGVALSFSLAKGKNLSSDWKKSLRTTWDSSIRLDVTPAQLRLSCSPGIEIDAFWPAQNMTLGGVTYDFRSATVNVDVRLVRGLGQGFLDYTQEAKTEIGGLVQRGLAGTAMSRPGYDPMQDQQILQTLQRIASNFQSQPSGGGGGDVTPGDLGNVSAEASLSMKSPFQQMQDGAGLSIPAGGKFTVRARGTGNLGQVAGASDVAGGVRAANLRSLELVSDAIHVIKDGEPVARLDRIRVEQGGVVHADEITLEGSAQKASSVETLVRLLIVAGGLASQGVPGEASLEMATRHPDVPATIVPGLTREKIESALTQGVRKLINDNAHAIPGLDLREIMGVKGGPGT